jgi:hypothetical protein
MFMVKLDETYLGSNPLAALGFCNGPLLPLRGGTQ